jgi:hypothetical protein
MKFPPPLECRLVLCSKFMIKRIKLTERDGGFVRVYSWDVDDSNGAVELFQYSKIVVLKECPGTNIYRPIKILCVVILEAIEDDEQGWLEALISGSTGSQTGVRDELLLNII